MSYVMVFTDALAELRLACLNIAKDVCDNSTDLLEITQELVDYVLTGKACEVNPGIFLNHQADSKNMDCRTAIVCAGDPVSSELAH